MGYVVWWVRQAYIRWICVTRAGDLARATVLLCIYMYSKKNTVDNFP
jgi:hypothetical protein